MKGVTTLYPRFAVVATSLRSWLLLVIRIYWGWQLVQTGWGKMHNIEKISGFFASLKIPFPAFNARFIAGLQTR